MCLLGVFGVDVGRMFGQYFVGILVVIWVLKGYPKSGADIYTGTRREIERLGAENELIVYQTDSRICHGMG